MLRRKARQMKHLQGTAKDPLDRTKQKDLANEIYELKQTVREIQTQLSTLVKDLKEVKECTLFLQGATVGRYMMQPMATPFRPSMYGYPPQQQPWIPGANYSYQVPPMSGAGYPVAIGSLHRMTPHSQPGSMEQLSYPNDIKDIYHIDRDNGSKPPPNVFNATDAQLRQGGSFGHSAGLEVGSSAASTVPFNIRHSKTSQPFDTATKTLATGANMPLFGSLVAVAKSPDKGSVDTEINVTVHPVSSDSANVENFGGLTYPIDYTKTTPKSESATSLAEKVESSGSSTFKFQTGSQSSTDVESPAKFGFTMRNPVKSSGKDEHDDVEEFEPNVDFKPVVELPELVEIKTGEEEEDKLFGERAKLFRYDQESKQWKDRGIGEMKILKHKITKRSRILMRREQVLKLCANHFLTAGMKLSKMSGSDKAWCWIAQDFSEEELKIETLAVKFKTTDQAAQFKKVFDEEIKTGEEEEDKLFGERAKLFRYDQESKQWKDRGIGEMRILKHKITKSSRILMRREQVLKLCTNHFLTAGMKLSKMSGSDKAWYWIAQDFSEEELKIETLAVKFKTTDQAAQFKKVFDEEVTKLFKIDRQECLACTTPKPGADDTKPTAVTSTGEFVFGSAPSCSFHFGTTTTTATTKAAEVKPGGFQFGQNPGLFNVPETESKGGFVFTKGSAVKPIGSAAVTEASDTGTSGFKFGSSSIAGEKPSFVFGKPTMSPVTGSASAATNPTSTASVATTKPSSTATTATTKPSSTTTTATTKPSSIPIIFTKPSSTSTTTTTKPSSTTTATTKPSSSTPITFKPSSITTTATTKPSSATTTATTKSDSTIAADSTKPSSTTRIIFTKPSSSTTTTSGKPISSTTAAPTPIFSTTMSNTKPTFSFGGASKGGVFGVNDSGKDNKPVQQTADATKPLSSFTFSLTPDKKPEGSSASSFQFNFDKCLACTTPKPGADDTKPTAVTSTGEFVFGSAPICSFHFGTTTTTATTKAAEVKPGGFQFGQNPGLFNVPETESKGGFVFTKGSAVKPMSSAAVTEASDTGTSGFKFGSSSIAGEKPSFVFGKPTMSSVTGSASAATNPTSTATMATTKPSSTATTATTKPSSTTTTATTKPSSIPIIFTKPSSTSTTTTAIPISTSAATTKQSSIPVIFTKPSSTSTATTTKPSSTTTATTKPSSSTPITFKPSSITTTATTKPSSATTTATTKSDSTIAADSTKPSSTTPIIFTKPSSSTTTTSGKPISSTTAAPTPIFSTTMSNTKPTFSFGGASKGGVFGVNDSGKDNKPVQQTADATKPLSSFTFSLTPDKKPEGSSASSFQFNFDKTPVEKKTTSLDKFSFSPTSKPVIPSPKSPETDAHGMYVNKEGEDAHIHFEPVVKLPDNVDIVTGEEDDDVLFEHRAKLYRWQDKQWKERGLGNVKILHHRVTGKSRLLMRREQVLKICCHHWITEKTSLQPMPNTQGKALVWFAMDFTEGEQPVPEKFSIRFKMAEIAEKFKEKFEEAKTSSSSIGKLTPGGAEGGKVASATSPVTTKTKPNIKPTSLFGSGSSVIKPVGGVFGSAEKSSNSSVLFSSLVSKVTDDGACTDISKSDPAGGATGGFASTGGGLFGNANSSFSFASLAAHAGGSTKAFQKDSTKPFSWPGAGQQLFGAGDNDGEHGDEDDVVQSDDIHFEPVTPLPPLAEVVTGEEGQTILFGERSKLYRFDPPSKQWKEKGIGEMKILKDPESGKVRLLMRREQVLKLACNHWLTPDIKFTPMTTSEMAWCWTAQDFTEGEPKLEQFAVKFKNKDLAEQFKEIIDTCQADLKKIKPSREDKVPIQVSEVSSNIGASVSGDASSSGKEGEVAPSQTEDDDDDDDYEDVEEEVLFEKRLTLSVRDGDKWKSLGTGQLKIILDDDVGGNKVIMETDSNKIVCSHIIVRESAIQANKKKKYCEWSPLDFSTDEPVRRDFRAQFSSDAAVEEFVKAFEQGRILATESDISERNMVTIFPREIDVPEVHSHNAAED